eukprot:4041393-Amphidinium_carterae.1
MKKVMTSESSPSKTSSTLRSVCATFKSMSEAVAVLLEEPAKMLVKSHKINLDAPGGEVIASDPFTTQEHALHSLVNSVIRLVAPDG